MGEKYTYKTFLDYKNRTVHHRIQQKYSDLHMWKNIHFFEHDPFDADTVIRSKLGQIKLM